MDKTYLCLAGAIVSEVFATSCLKASNGFSRLWPTVLSVIGYCCAFYLLSLTMKAIPTGIVYAIWSGVGIVLISLIGFFVFKQSLDWAAIIGIALIMAGVLVINLFSRTH
ncbi:DMT family transporter [Acetobacter orientalis]|uniref:DMT family transporter n=1 Tax=Acetobacter orientalis TaxID=146474 RepID=UPI0039ED3798